MDNKDEFQGRKIFMVTKNIKGCHAQSLVVKVDCHPYHLSTTTHSCLSSHTTCQFLDH